MTECNWDAAHSTVEEALRITKEDRNEKAGNAEDNFSKIAKVWNGLLEEKLLPGVEITPADTARMMIGLKLCRDMHAPHRDNRVDMHGYTLCLDRVQPAGGDRPSASAVSSPDRGMELLRAYASPANPLVPKNAKPSPEDKRVMMARCDSVYGSRQCPELIECGSRECAEHLNSLSPTEGAA